MPQTDWIPQGSYVHPKQPLVVEAPTSCCSKGMCDNRVVGTWEANDMNAGPVCPVHDDRNAWRHESLIDYTVKLIPMAGDLDATALRMSALAYDCYIKEMQRHLQLCDALLPDPTPEAPLMFAGYIPVIRDASLDGFVMQFDYALPHAVPGRV